MVKALYMFIVIKRRMATQSGKDRIFQLVNELKDKFENELLNKEKECYRSNEAEFEKFFKNHEETPFIQDFCPKHSHYSEEPLFYRRNWKIIKKCQELYSLLSTSEKSPTVQKLCERFKYVEKIELPSKKAGTMTIFEIGLAIQLECFACYQLYCLSKEDFEELRGEPMV